MALCERQVFYVIVLVKQRREEILIVLFIKDNLKTWVDVNIQDWRPWLCFLKFSFYGLQGDQSKTYFIRFALQ